MRIQTEENNKNKQFIRVIGKIKLLILRNQTT